jgi:RimJ/RimL family protein N-acetyltransferase
MAATIAETERLLLREWRPEDREPFARMNADPVVMRHFPRVMTRAESESLADRIEEHYREHGFTLYAAELREEEAFIGYVGLVRVDFEAVFTPAVEIGWRLDARYWNRGLATEGASAVVRYGFEVLGLEEIVSFAVPANHASRRVMEKIGMTRDAQGDFDHPRLAEGHPLRRHVLYQMRDPAKAAVS